MTRYIDEHTGSFGVEPICRTLAIAPSSYYAARTRPPSARTIRDAEVTGTLTELHSTHFGVYGVRKLWHAARRAGVDVGRDQVARLMRLAGLRGVVREPRIRTTVPAVVGGRPVL